MVNNIIILIRGSNSKFIEQLYFLNEKASKTTRVKDKSSIVGYLINF